MRSISALVMLVSLLASGCGKTEQYRDTGERFKPVWVRQSDGERAGKEEVLSARDECAARVRGDTRRASEAFASDVWGFEMKKCMADEGFDLVEKPKPAAPPE